MKFAAQVFAFCVSGLLASIVSSPAQAAYTTLYDNTATFSGAGYAGGGATTIGNSISTTMVADDITAGAGLGGRSVDQFSFSVGNFNSTAVTASATVYFYNADPTTASPSTLITSLTFTPITFTAGVVQVFTYSSPTSLFTMPTGLFWAGISFSNLGGTTSATAAQLNNLGQGLYDPPSVGSSQDAFFQANSATTIGRRTRPAASTTSGAARTRISAGTSPP